MVAGMIHDHARYMVLRNGWDEDRVFFVWYFIGSTRWTPTSCKWRIWGPCKCPYKWVTGVISYTVTLYKWICNPTYTWLWGPPCRFRIWLQVGEKVGLHMQNPIKKDPCFFLLIFSSIHPIPCWPSNLNIHVTSKIQKDSFPKRISSSRVGPHFSFVGVHVFFRDVWLPINPNNSSQTSPCVVLSPFAVRPYETPRWQGRWTLWSPCF